MDYLLLKGFRDGSWRRQTGMNSSTRLHHSVMKDVDDPMSLFTSILKDIAEETIPKTSAVPKHLNKSWLSDICKDAIKERNMALERFIQG